MYIFRQNISPRRRRRRRLLGWISICIYRRSRVCVRYCAFISVRLARQLAVIWEIFWQRPRGKCERTGLAAALFLELAKNAQRPEMTDGEICWQKYPAISYFFFFLAFVLFFPSFSLSYNVTAFPPLARARADAALRRHTQRALLLLRLPRGRPQNENKVHCLGGDVYLFI